MEEVNVGLTEFLDNYKEEIAASVVENYPPVYKFEYRRKYVEAITKLKRRPYLAQLDGICALAELFSKEDSGVVVGEMGVGKTIVAIIAVYVCGFKKVLVVCPPHLVKKWEREIMVTLPDGAVQCHHLKRFSDVDKAAGVTGNGNAHFYIVGRERAKLSYQWEAAYGMRNSLVETGNGNKVRVQYVVCPGCGKPILDSEGIPVAAEDLKGKKTWCRSCGGALWQAKREGPRRYSIAEYIKKRRKGFFDLLVVDEAHEYKARSSAQGYAAGQLAGVCKKSVALTGTLFGGYSSTLFFLLYRLAKTFKGSYGHSQVSKWIDHYGIWEKVVKYESDDYSENVSSRGKRYYYAPREKPGISPVILPKYLLDKTVFIRLSDIAIDLPPLEEEIVGVEMADAQAEAYRGFFNELRSALLEELKAGSKSLLAIYLQALLTYPDRCTVEETVYNKRGDAVAYAPALDQGVLYPKEEKLIEIVKAEREGGRKVLVYCTHTQRRDVTGRLEEALKKEGIRVEILRPSVPSEKRENWIEEHAGDLECLITNPRLVQTGLDLVMFPAMVFYEPEYSVYSLRQASRRSWRIGQDKPVKVYYLIYAGTMQEQALKLIALKMKTSLVIEGDLGEDGLATYNVGDDNLYYELARNIANNVQIGESIDSIWRGVQQKEVRGAEKDLLIDSLEGFMDVPDLSAVLRRPVKEIKRLFNPELFEKLYQVKMEGKSRRKRTIETAENQLTLF